eukprot:ctg_2079.g561
MAAAARAAAVAEAVSRPAGVYAPARHPSHPSRTPSLPFLHGGLSDSHRSAETAADEDQRVAAHEHQRQLPFSGAHDLLKRLLVDLCAHHRLFGVADHHVQVLVVAVQPPDQLALPTQLHVHQLVQTQPHQIARLSQDAPASQSPIGAGALRSTARALHKMRRWH